MLPLIWLLFVFPAYSLILLYAGAHIFHSGALGKSPMPTLPKFSLSRGGNGLPKKKPEDRLPAV